MSWRNIEANSGEYSHFLEEANALTEEGKKTEEKLRILIEEKEELLHDLREKENEVVMVRNRDRESELRKSIENEARALQEKQERIDDTRNALERLRREIRVLRDIDAEYEKNLRDEEWMEKNAKGE